MFSRQSDGIFLARPRSTPAGAPRLAVKDLLDTAGLTTTYGSTIFADHVPKESAESVRLLEAAGYATAGKTNLHEFAYGVTSENPHFGTVPNPAAPGRIAGGSSGGSAAALAAGLVELALGTDSAGSIRIPAACCGVVGFKPTYGLVSTHGCFPLAPTHDHVGPMARSVEACALAMEALVLGWERRSLDSLSELRLAVAWLDGADPLVRARAEGAAACFAHPATVDLPALPRDGQPLWSNGFMREIADVHRELYAELAELYGAEVAAKIERCLAVRDEDCAGYAELQEHARERLLTQLEGFDLLLTPTVRFVAPRPGDPRTTELIDLTAAFNLVGWPALALPSGPAEDELPASVQIVGRGGEDALVLAAGALLERALGRA